MNKPADKHEIYTGFRKDNSLDSKLLVGAAFKEENATYYKIRLMMFPGQTYYLVKNKEANDRYTVYSRMKHTDQKVQFLNPVGNGILDSKLQSYLEIKFPLFRAHLYMSLYPAKQN